MRRVPVRVEEGDADRRDGLARAPEPDLHRARRAGGPEQLADAAELARRLERHLERRRDLLGRDDRLASSGEDRTRRLEHLRLVAQRERRIPPRREHDVLRRRGERRRAHAEQREREDRREAPTARADELRRREGRGKIVSVHAWLGRGSCSDPVSAGRRASCALSAGPRYAPVAMAGMRGALSSNPTSSPIDFTGECFPDLLLGAHDAGTEARTFSRCERVLRQRGRLDGSERGGWRQGRGGLECSHREALLCDRHHGDS